MGYYTRYDLETIDSNDLGKRILSEMDADKFYGLNVDNALKYIGDFELGLSIGATDEVKWYDHEDDMKELSIKFPNTLFRLHGYGEEQGDEWYKYFKNGKMQKCDAIVTFEKYDEGKLR